MISNIRAERSRLDMTQEQLAEKIGVSGSAVRSWESGKTLPGPQQLLSMSELFSCSTDWLLGRVDERTGLVGR